MCTQIEFNVSKDNMSLKCHDEFSLIFCDHILFMKMHNKINIDVLTTLLSEEESTHEVKLNS